MWKIWSRNILPTERQVDNQMDGQKNGQKNGETDNVKIRMDIRHMVNIIRTWIDILLSTDGQMDKWMDRQMSKMKPVNPLLQSWSRGNKQLHIMYTYPDSKVHGANMGPVGPRWALCWPHEPCYQGKLWDAVTHANSLAPWKFES